MPRIQKTTMFLQAGRSGRVTNVIYHTIALAVGFLLDLIFGDPRWLYHPVCLIGNLISVLEKGIRRIFPKTNAGELAVSSVRTFPGGGCDPGDILVLPAPCYQIVKG